MSDSGEAPGSSPPAPESSSKTPSPPGSSDSAPPPPPTPSSSAPPPSSQPPPPSPPPPSPHTSNSTSPTPPSNSGSPSPPSPPTNSNSTTPSPPSGSEPPKPSPPSESNSKSSPPPKQSPPSSSSPSPPPPPSSSSPPDAPVQQSPPPAGNPPSGTPPSSEKPSPPAPPPPTGSSTAPTPSVSPVTPAPGGSGSTPPAQNISPPLAESPPAANPSPATPTSPVPSTESPSTSSGKSPPPPSSHRSSNLSPPSSHAKTDSSSSSSGSSGRLGTGFIVGLCVLGVFIVLAALVCVLSKRKKKKRAELLTQYRPPHNFSGKSDGYYYGQPHSTGLSGPTDTFYGSQPPHSPHGLGNSYGSQRGNVYHAGPPDSSGIGTKSWFSYEEVTEMTNGFSRQNIIGEGGFGCVYKGLLPDGKPVAVKQLKAGSGQGEREFRAEVDIISRVHHRHLVSLVGYCIAESQRLLIYEFVPNNTLEHHLHGKGMLVLDWDKRIRIARGAARGLSYLHEDCHPKIIHRDIKSANILLEDAFEAQVADFGLAKPSNDTHTHVSTRIMGTFGYLAPEYASSGKLTDRSDVFSFGVVLLELITGRKPVDASQPLGDESLVEWARPHLMHALETGDFGELVEPRLEGKYVGSEMFRMVEAAAASIRHSAPKRPRMVQVARALESESDMSDLSNGVKFGQSTVYDSGQYNQEITKFRRMALGSGDSTEYDMLSGEYTSREVSRGGPNSWKTRNSSECPSSESETRAMNGTKW